MQTFTVSEAQELTKQAKQGSFLTKGMVIDLIRRAAKKGNESIEIKGLPEGVAEDLASDEYGFTISGETISWKKPV